MTFTIVYIDDAIAAHYSQWDLQHSEHCDWGPSVYRPVLYAFRTVYKIHLKESVDHAPYVYGYLGSEPKIDMFPKLFREYMSSYYVDDPQPPAWYIETPSNAIQLLRENSWDLWNTMTTIANLVYPENNIRLAVKKESLRNDFTTGFWIAVMMRAGLMTENDVYGFDF